MDSSGLSPAESTVLDLVDEDEVVNFLQELIRAKSDFPPGDTRVALQIVADKLVRSGIPYQILAKSAVQPNLLARLSEGEGSGQKLLYHAHIDTVPAGDLATWTVDPFGGTRVGDRVYGRGAGDDKGSVVAQVMALVTLARSGTVQKQSIELAIVADEESGAEAGTKWLHDAGRLACDYLVVGEQTDNQVAIGERVACGIDLTILGKSAHGAMPWAGDNAILKAARVITHLEQTLLPRLEARRHRHLPPATLNFGRIEGGSQWNVVAERCLIKMDRRLLPNETREAAVAEIREILEIYSATVEPLSYKLYSAGEVAANIDTSPRDPFVLMANRALRDITGEKHNLTGYVQTSDGRWFARDGIPIIIFGPGDPRLAHSADEFVSVKQLVEATRFYTLLALRWAAEQDTHIGGRATDLQGADNRPSMRFV